MDCGVGRIEVSDADVDEHVDDEDEHDEDGESLKRFVSDCCCC